MERVKEIAAFGLWFLGLSYIVLWVATGPLNRAIALDIHPEALPRGLHLVGLLAAIAVFVRLLLTAMRNARKPSPDDLPSPRRRFRRPDPTVKRIKARDHFGLRGLQQ